MITCYLGCSPSSTPITHAPPLAQALAFTGAGEGLTALFYIGIALYGVGVGILIGAWMHARWNRRDR